jgi:hypothetical protein
MQLTKFIVLSALALAVSPAFGSAEDDWFRQANTSNVACPTLEGYPDCHPSGRAPFAVYGEESRPTRR